MNTQRVKKYLLYALGEIFLIVVGILLAIQLNIQNENRKSHDRQLDYLRLIRNEMNSNLEHVENEIKSAERATSHMKTMMSVFMIPKYSIADDSLHKIMNQAFNREFQFKYNDGVLTEIKAAGGLREIENDSISILLASWTAKIEAIRLQEKDVYDYREKISNLWIENGNAFAVYKSVSDFEGIGSNWDLIENQTFTNATLAMYATTRGLVNAFYKPIKEDMKELIHMIDKELEQSNN